jgi:hypothetical protein
MTVTHIPYADFRCPTIAMCVSSPQSRITVCHSAIERSYFFSIEGKYEAGPCFGQDVDDSTTVLSSFSIAIDS